MECDRLSDILSGTLTTPQKCLVELFSDKTGPSSLDVTYGHLRWLIRRMMSDLASRGVVKGSVVGLVLPNSIAHVVSFFAITSLGAVVAPINHGYTVDEIQYFLQDLKVSHVISSRLTPPWRACKQSYSIISDDVRASPLHKVCAAVVRSKASGRNTVIISIDVGCDKTGVTELVTHFAREGKPHVEHNFHAILREDAETHVPRPLANEVCLYLHTSGTTSKPKLVGLRHRNLLSSISNIRQTYKLNTSDVTLLVMPLFHVHGLMSSLMSTLASGGLVVIPPGGSFSGSTFLRDCRRWKVTWYSAVPTIHQILLIRTEEHKDSGRLVPTLRFIRSCSSALAPATLLQLEKRFGVPVLEAYAMTEASHQMTSNPLPSALENRVPGSVGKIMSAMELRILNERNQIVPQGSEGEVCIRGPNVMSNYVTDSFKINEEAFAGGWFHTGDQGKVDPNGFLFITGRLKELINRGGEKISPPEIDAQLLACHEAVQEAISFGGPNSKYGEVVLAAIVLKKEYRKADRDVVVNDILRALRTRLTHFKVPEKLFVTDSLPKTASGKIQRRLVATHFLKNVDTGGIEGGKSDALLSVGEILALALRGVEVVYGVVGWPLTRVIRDLTYCNKMAHTGPTFVGMRSETAACYAAACQGYLHQSLPGVAISTGGPGFGLALPGLAHATVNRMPLVLIAACADNPEPPYEGFQECPQSKVVSQLVSLGAAKAAYTAHDIHSLLIHLRKSFSVARQAPPGGVYVEIPNSLVTKTMRMNDLTFEEPEPLLYTSDYEKFLEIAVHQLYKCRRPLLVIGKGAAYARVESHIQDLLRAAGGCLPVLTTPMGKGIISEDDSVCVNQVRSVAMSRADFVLVVGARLNWILGEGKSPPFARDCFFAHIEADQDSILRNEKRFGARYIPLNGNIPTVLRALERSLMSASMRAPAPGWREWLSELQRGRDANSKALDQRVSKDLKTCEKGQLRFRPVMRTVVSVLKSNSIHFELVAEGGNTMDISRLMVPITRPRQRLDAGTWGTMGVGLPYAISIAIHHGGNRVVVALEGDSAFGFSAAECETICRLKLPILIIVFNNSAIYGGPESKSVYVGDNPHARIIQPSKFRDSMRLDPNRFVKNARYETIMEAFGGFGFYVDTYDELQVSVQRCLDPASQRLPAIINVIIDPNDTGKLTTKSSM